MDSGVLYARLMDAAEALGVEVRTAAVEPPGGACRIRGRVLVMLSHEASVDEKVDVLVGALAGMPGLDGVFLLPEVRERLEAERARRPPDVSPPGER